MGGKKQRNIRDENYRSYALAMTEDGKNQLPLYRSELAYWGAIHASLK